MSNCSGHAPQSYLSLLCRSQERRRGICFPPVCWIYPWFSPGRWWIWFQTPAHGEHQNTRYLEAKLEHKNTKQTSIIQQLKPIKAMERKLLHLHESVSIVLSVAASLDLTSRRLMEIAWITWISKDFSSWLQICYFKLFWCKIFEVFEEKANVFSNKSNQDFSIILTFPVHPVIQISFFFLLCMSVCFCN